MLFALEQNELDLSKSIINSLLKLKKLNAVRTERTKGILNYFSTATLSKNKQDHIIMQGYMCGPTIKDLHYKVELNEVSGQAKLTFYVHSGNPSKDYEKVKNELSKLVKTTKERVKQIEQKPGGYNMAYGISLCPGSAGPKSKANFQEAIASEQLTLNFEKYCTENKFQLRKRVRA